VLNEITLHVFKASARLLHMSLVAVDKKLDHLLACSFLRSNPQDGSSAQQPFPRHREFRYYMHDTIAQYYHLHYETEDIHVFGYEFYLGTEGGYHVYQEAFTRSNIPPAIQNIFADLEQICTGNTELVGFYDDGTVALQTNSLLYHGTYTQRIYPRIATAKPPPVGTGIFEWPAELEKPDQAFYAALPPNLTEQEMETRFREYHRARGRETQDQIDTYHRQFAEEREGVIHRTADPYKDTCMSYIQDGIDWRNAYHRPTVPSQTFTGNPTEQFEQLMNSLQASKCKVINLPKISGPMQQPSAVTYMHKHHIHGKYYEQMKMSFNETNTQLKLHILWHTDLERAGDLSQEWTNVDIRYAQRPSTTYENMSIEDFSKIDGLAFLHIDSIWIKDDSIVLKLHTRREAVYIAHQAIPIRNFPPPLTTCYTLIFQTQRQLPEAHESHMPYEH
jgi:hypothetical protein